MLWAALAVGVVIGFFIGDRWREWVGDGWEWLVSLLAAVGLITVVVIAAAIGAGWSPW